MISLLVDESYAFDYLAILMVKHDFSKNDSIQKQIEECVEHLKEQLGLKKFNEILSSEEFSKLKHSNQETFRLVDLAKTDKCNASDVDKSNYNRCLARNELQKKFFGTTVTEQKFGYEIYDESSGKMTDLEAIKYLSPKKYDVELKRIGRTGDGGYVIAMDGSYDRLVSFGVGGDISFENGMCKLFPDLKVDTYDGTVKGLPSGANKNIVFHKENIDGKKLNSYFSDLENVFLKCDIEGEEYNFSTSTIPECVKQIVLELHWIKTRWDDVKTLLSFFRKSGFSVIHVHGNNFAGTASIAGFTIPDVVELTFIRKNLIEYKPNNEYPINGLDTPNNFSKPDIRFKMIG